MPVDLLPTHRGGGGRGPGTAVKLQNAFDKGLGMAGLKATKGGSGDKEKAYIVRQNWVLKTVLLLIVIFAVGMMILFSTALKVSVTRRDMLTSERMHHKVEHAAQVKLVRAHVDLLRALEQEVHETSRVEEFRSAADKALGDHMNSVSALLKSKGVDEAVVKEIEAKDEKLRQDLDARLHHVVQHFQGVAQRARTSLKKVAHDIVSDVELEKKESDRYKEKMKKEYGIDVDPDKDEPVEHDKYGIIDQFEEDDDHEDDDTEIAHELEAFFAKLKAHDFPLLDKATIDDWENDMLGISRALEDEGQELDLDKIAERVNGKVAMHAPNAPKFDAKRHSSIIDYYEMRIEEAKLAFHKQSLLDLYDGWKQDGKINPLTVLSGLEQIAEENNMYLLYEWLDGNEGDEDPDDS